MLFIVGKKKNNLREYFFEKSDIRQRSKKADLLGNTENTVSCDRCREGVVLCWNCV